jgi:hypothetical protein
LIFWQEHVEVRVEDGLRHKLEILVLDSSLIGPFFSNERNFHGALEILLDLPKFFHRIIQDIISVDIEIQKDEPLDRELMMKIDFLKHGAEPILHILLDIHLLFIDRFKLYNFVFIVEA